MKKLTIIILLFPVLTLLAQIAPENFEINKDKLSKITDTNPLGNSILDIVVEDDTVWLGTTRGVSRSTDGGETWRNYYGTSAFGEESIPAIGYYNGVFYAATGHSTEKDGSTLPEGSGLKYTTDNGESWQSVPQPVDEPGDSSVIYGVNTLRALPVTVEINNITYDIALTPGTIWITTFAGGLRKSTDMGLSWERVVLPPDYLNELYPDSSYSFALQPVAGAFGDENYLNHRVFSVVAMNDSTLLVGTAGGINKGFIDSQTGDITWKKFNHLNQDYAISGNFVTAMAYNQWDESIWAATWKAEGASEYYGVSASFDGGENWKVYLRGEKAHNFGFRKYNISGLETAQVMASTDNGLFRTTEEGNNPATWITPQNIVDDVTLIPMVSKKFYSVMYQKYRGSNYIWIGSAIDGLGLLKESTGIWTGEWKVLTSSPVLPSVSESYAFPNPFSPDDEYTRIKYKFDQASADVTIRIMDFGMNLVRTLIQKAPRDGGQERLEIWDGRDESGGIVPNGVYFYRIDVDEDEPVFGKIMVLM